MIEAEILSEATAEGAGIESRGYALHDEIVLDCPACRKKLVSILVVKLNTPAFPPYNDVTFQVKCPFCKTLSFKKRFNQVKLYLQAMFPLFISNMDTSIINNIPNTTIYVV